ncbi:MAG TPA: metalloregulator ArsR/SmtB family transcription factor [Acidimicrobiales bacterium]|nr:metalloregulator ArsR/SmtB family transcription factor [Acidimicrobiales bacterium]
MPEDLSLVFKALADPTRRLLLDRLHERNGQTLGELCSSLSMARQSASQHLAVLEAANLISTTWHGREKLHHLNPVPLHEVQERWIDKFERPRLRTLSAVRRRAESEESHVTDKPSYVYVTYIESTPERVWEALTDPDLTEQYWTRRNEADSWEVGSRWTHVRPDGTGDDGGGTVLESDPPRRLVFDWGTLDEEDPHLSRVSFDIEPHGDIVRLTVTHEDLFDEVAFQNISQGWPAVLSNLKSLLETGRVLADSPFEVGAPA